jgi:hypothetical protein
VPGGGSHRTTREGEGNRKVEEGTRKVEEGTRKVEVEGRTAKGEEAIAATLVESDRH